MKLEKTLLATTLLFIARIFRADILMFSFLKKQKNQSPVESETEAAPNHAISTAQNPLEASDTVTPSSEQISSEISPETLAPTLESSEQNTLTAELPEKNSPTDSFFARLKNSLAKTRLNFTKSLSNLLMGQKTIDDDLLDDLEMILLSADIGIDATDKIIQNLTEQVSRKELKDSEALLNALQKQLEELLIPVEKPLLPESKHSTFVILMVGVNGVGKTTTIGKLAKRFQNEGKSVMLAAGDTFRAAAVEQLQTW